MSQLVSLPQRQPEVPHAHSGRVAELSIVVPTFKESGNVAELVQRLDAALEGVDWEVIFVDDNSPDGTTEVVKAIAATDPRVRCLRRVRRRGLAGACIEGMLSSSAPYVGVMDADLQHDENLLPRMLATLKKGDTDLVVGSRYIAGGNAKVFSKSRGMMSKAAGSLARMLTRIELTDPMSGFFMMRRDRFDPLAGSLSTQRLQDPARHRADGQGRFAHRRGTLCVRIAHLWRVQARRAGRPRFPGPAADQAHRRRGDAAIPVLCAGGDARPSRSSRGAEAVAALLHVRAVAGDRDVRRHDGEFPAQQQPHLPR